MSSISVVTVSKIDCDPSTVKFPLTWTAPLNVATPVLLMLSAPEDAMVKFVPSPSIFSPSSPNVKPMSAPMLMSPPDPTVIVKSVSSDSIFSCVPSNRPLFTGIFTSAVGLNTILFPVTVKSVPSPSIFSAASPNTTPLFAGNTTSVVGERFIVFPVIVKSVPSPSIPSPSSPNFKPIFAGILMSPFDPTVIVKSVSSDSIFSCVPNINPMFTGILTSATAVRLMLFPAIVKSVPSPSIFSPSSPKVRPMSAGILISPFEPTANVMSVPSPDIFSSAAPNWSCLPDAIFNAETSPSNLNTSVVADPPSLTAKITSLSDVPLATVISLLDAVTNNSVATVALPDAFVPITPLAVNDACVSLNSKNVSLAATCASTYALIDCCVDNAVALFDAILSSSTIEVTSVVVPI